mmetsp:Transcript_3919/g.7849  ORF Transcript_3919/g.7849 Transcript_3919/m.7849 type:complete len:253 (-) Transcript_3919:590-1348(-)
MTISLLLVEILRPAVRAVRHVPAAEAAPTLHPEHVVADEVVDLVVLVVVVVIVIAVILPNEDVEDVTTATAIIHPHAGTVITGPRRRRHHPVAEVTTTNLRRRVEEIGIIHRGLRRCGEVIPTEIIRLDLRRCGDLRGHRPCEEAAGVDAGSSVVMMVLRESVFWCEMYRPTLHLMICTQRLGELGKSGMSTFPGIIIRSNRKDLPSLSMLLRNKPRKPEKKWIVSLSREDLWMLSLRKKNARRLVKCADAW